MNIINNKTTYLSKYIVNINQIGGGSDFVVMDYYNSEDIDLWCELINKSYTDASYTRSEAIALLTNHPFIKNNKTVFYIEDGHKVATISYGVIKTSCDTAGFFRIAVLPAYQNRGIGKKLLQYAENQVCSAGIRKVEEAIVLKRISSLIMHFKLGYLPEKSSRARAYKRSKARQLLLWAIGYDLIINLYTWQIYKKYLLSTK